MVALPPVLTAQDVALWLTWPTSRVVRMARRGLIPCRVLPDGDLAFSPDDLRAWLASLPAPTGKEAALASS